MYPYNSGHPPLSPPSPSGNESSPRPSPGGIYRSKGGFVPNARHYFFSEGDHGCQIFHDIAFRPDVKSRFYDTMGNGLKLSGRMEAHHQYIKLGKGIDKMSSKLILEGQDIRLQFALLKERQRAFEEAERHVEMAKVVHVDGTTILNCFRNLPRVLTRELVDDMVSENHVNIKEDSAADIAERLRLHSSCQARVC